MNILVQSNMVLMLLALAGCAAACFQFASKPFGASVSVRERPLLYPVRFGPSWVHSAPVRLILNQSLRKSHQAGNGLCRRSMHIDTGQSDARFKSLSMTNDIHNRQEV